MTELINLQGTIFILIAVGFVLKRYKIINQEGQKTITDLVINVILPCNIIKEFQLVSTCGLPVLQSFPVLLI